MEETPEPGQAALIARLLESFITCVIEAYVNSNSLEWAARMLEFTVPERVVLRRKTMLQAYNEVEELQAMDALVGQLVVRFKAASEQGEANEIRLSQAI